ncbi:OprD family porin [Stutzerimonas sp. NM35]
MNKSTLALAVTLGILAQQAGAAGFIEDSKASLDLRNFYFNNDNRESQNASGQVNEWGQGFVLNFTSGFTEGTVGFGVDALGLLGVRLDGGGRAGKAGIERTPGQLFPLESDGSAVDNYSTLGLTGKARLSKTELRYGTLLPKLPILVHNDGRLLPQTFEGGQITSKEISNVTLTGGLIERAVGRASTNGTGLAVAGGTQESNKFWFAGGDWQATPELTAQYYYANLEDYYKQHFAGLLHVLALGDKQSLKTDLRYFRTDSEGANAKGTTGYTTSGYTRNNSGEIDNNTWSAAFTYSLGGHAFTLGHQRVSENSNFVQLNQGNLANEGAGGASVYLLTDRQLFSFTRAGERTTFGEYGYNFAALGVPGLRASTAYLKGTNIKTAGRDQKEWERDFRLDYTLQSGPLKGVSFSWRNASLRTEAANDTDQNRLIVSYSLPLL